MVRQEGPAPEPAGVEETVLLRGTFRLRRSQIERVIDGARVAMFYAGEGGDAQDRGGVIWELGRSDEDANIVFEPLNPKAK